LVVVVVVGFVVVLWFFSCCGGCIVIAFSSSSSSFFFFFLLPSSLRVFSFLPSFFLSFFACCFLFPTAAERSGLDAAPSASFVVFLKYCSTFFRSIPVYSLIAFVRSFSFCFNCS
jgi:hypothetical protein